MDMSNEDTETLERGEMGDEETFSLGSPEDETAVEDKSDHDDNASTETHEVAHVSKIELLKRPKLSGAQSRKLRREAKIAAGTWTKENPFKKDRIGLPFPKFQSAYNGYPSGSRDAFEERGSQRGGYKRPRDDYRTSPYPSKTPRLFSNPNDIASELRMAVIESRHPEVTLDEEQADLVQDRLVDAMDSSPSGSDGPLQFTRTTYNAGVLWMICANTDTKIWLMNIVGSLGGLWQDASLKAVESKNLPKRPRALVFIPGQEQPEESVRARLEKQNPGLKVGGWLLLSRKVEADGTILAYSMDETSFKVLEQNEYRAYYKLGRVTFRVLKGLNAADPSGQAAPRW